MNLSLYYIVELNNIEGIPKFVLVKDENLVDFISKYNKEIYTIVNINGIGNINLDYNDFLKKEDI